MDTIKPNDDGSVLLDVFLVLAENIRTLLSIPFASALIAVAIVAVIPPRYTATARLLPPPQQQSASFGVLAQLSLTAGLNLGAAGLKNPAEQYAGLLKSATIYDRIIERFDLRKHYDERYLEDVRKELGKRVRISAGIKDGIVTIEVEDEDPRRAASMANAFVEELRQLTTTLAVTEAAQRRLFFQGQLDKAKANLERAELVLRQSGINEATLKTVPQSTLESLARIKAQISLQEIRLASMRTFMTESHPDFRLAMQELSALRGELARAEQTTGKKASGGGADYISRFRDFKYHEALFELVAKQHEIARLDEAREIGVQVIDIAQAPEKRTKPRKVLIISTTFLAVLLLTALLLMLRNALAGMSSEPVTSEKVRRIRQSLGFRR